MEIQLWREILEPYELAVEELVVKFRHLIAANRRAGKYSPIEQVNGRVKTISSILDKCQKKDVEFDHFEEKIEDIIISSVDVNSHVTGEKIGKCLEADEDAAELYIKHLIETALVKKLFNSCSGIYSEMVVT